MDSKDALKILAKQNPLAAKAIELVFFEGLTHTEAAQALSLTTPEFRHTMKVAKPLMRKIMGTDADSIE